MDDSVNPADWGAVDTTAVPPTTNESPATWGAVAAESVAAESSPAQWGAKPVAQPQPPHGFWDTLTAPGIVNETTPAVLLHRRDDVRVATEQFNREGAWDKERARRLAAGESTNGMEQWKLAQINERIKATKPDTGPDPKFGEILTALKDQIKTDPGGFAGGLVRSVITAPELLFMPEALPARMAAFVARAGKAAQATARVGTQAAQVGGLVGAESTMKQLVEKGQANPDQVLADTLMVATPIVAIKAGMSALRAAGKVVPDAAIIKEAADAIKGGASPTDAVMDALKKYGLSKDDAAKISEATDVVPYDPGRTVSGEVSTDKGKSWTPYAAAAVTAGAAAVGYGQMDEEQKRTAMLLGAVGATALVGKEPLWYSPLAKSIFTKMPVNKEGAIKPEQMRQWIEARANDGTINKEELQYSGLPEWLKLQEGPVSKADIDGYLRNNGVQVQEKMLGMEVPKPERSVFWDRLDPRIAPVQMHDAASISDAQSKYRQDVQENKARWVDENGRAVSATEAADIADQWKRYWDANKNGGENPKFATYQLPGGENYRELLLTLPVGKDGITTRGA